MNQRLGGYVRMNVEDRRKVVQELKADGASNRDVAAEFGVNPATVDRAENAANAAPEPIGAGEETDGNAQMRYP